MKKIRDKRIKIVIVGLIVNIFLFLSKLYVGSQSNSVAIFADAMNNLSDLISSMILLIGIALANKPADSEHPYGHERFELIGGFVLALIFIYLGIDLARTSITSISSNPAQQRFDMVIGINLLSITLKFGLYLLYRRYAKDDKLSILNSGAKDSMNDVMISIGIVMGALILKVFSYNIDGYIGLFISALIVVDAIKQLQEYISRIIGERPDGTVIQSIEQILKDNRDILSYHDLMIHNYGKKNSYGSVHIDIDGTLSLFAAHEIADNIEKKLRDDLGISLVVHLDPVDLNDTELNAIRQTVNELLEKYTWFKSYHDLRMSNDIIEIDVVLNESRLSDADIEAIFMKTLRQFGHPLRITLDRNYLLRR